MTARGKLYLKLSAALMANLAAGSLEPLVEGCGADCCDVEHSFISLISSWSFLFKFSKFLLITKGTAFSAYPQLYKNELTGTTSDLVQSHLKFSKI